MLTVPNQGKSTIYNESGLLYRLNNKKIIFLIIFTTFLIGINILIHNNYSFYSNTIMKITNVENTMTTKTETIVNTYEFYYTQVLTGEIMNGPKAGDVLILENQYSSSQVYISEYHKGDEVFVSFSENDIGNYIGTITGLKRDTFVVFLGSVFMLLLVLLEVKRGILTILSVFINIGAFYICLELYQKGYNIFLLSIVCSLFFTIFSISFINGFNKQTLTCILSTIISVSITIALFKIVLIFTGDIDYSYMDFLIQPKNAPDIFMAELLIGCLGTIMDISITMSSAVKELTFKDPNISIKKIFASGREIADDIMGTMINVLLFTYICGGIPMILYLLRNNIQFINVITIYLPYEIDRFLIGAIGILLAIPLSLLISILFEKGGRKKCKLS